MTGLAIGALAIGSRSEWWVEAVKMPRAGAKITGNDLASCKTSFAHGGLATTETKDCVVLTVAKFQIVGVLFIAASMRSAKIFG